MSTGGRFAAAEAELLRLVVSQVNVEPLPGGAKGEFLMGIDLGGADRRLEALAERMDAAETKRAALGMLEDFVRAERSRRQRGAA
jgi:hypothetical protein